MGKVSKVQWSNKLFWDILNRGNHFYLKMSRLFLFLLLLSLSSCYTSKKVNYLQSEKQQLSFPVQQTKYKVQPNDVLNIKVQSRDPEQSNFFNITTIENGNFESNPAALFLTGHPVNDEGKINIAIVGELKVSDLTVEEIRELIQREIDNHLINATVLVKLTSFKISVLGDVQRPGTNYVYNTQSTIFEALSAAGDLNLSAKRKNVKLIRQVGDETVVTNLDLTSPAIIESPYYFLHPNDVIYVETSKPNIAQSNLGVFALILSAISTGILIFNVSFK
ncbi:MAG: polysaccharide biosynthesis/export family protein [Aurantibacter sp.]